ncbi:S41 family peptidase [Paenibacillus albidus]|uniref:S41 family peptidase n=1 Tax=Paenibacillus albidus TaxID=2041023 RepID=UPI001E3478BA|nr:S41 family peptidase [Paenibacillus albidus]
MPNLPPEASTQFQSYSKWENNIVPFHPVGFKGKIFLLVDSRVYSAAEGFAVFAKNTNFATLVGARTGGDGIGIDPLLLALPHSGYVASFSFSMGLVSDGSCNEETKTLPDVEVDPDASRPLLDQPAVRRVLELAGK